MAEVTFGEWLRRQRAARGLTQAQLALHLSCSTSALKKLEAEQRRPSAQLIERLAVTFQIPAHERPTFQRYARGDWRAVPTLPLAEAPWRAPRPAPRTNVPIPLTSFIGRKREMDDLLRLLGQQRLVTLTGPGGVGKTRLATQAATKLLRKFDDGVWWVELAPLADENLVPQAVAQALAVREVPGQPLTEVLAQALREQRLLLVLDNCEHLIGACAQLAHDLLAHCAHLKILATSREALDITGEMAYQVPTLSRPSPDQQSLTELLLAYESIRLFVERAHAKAGFTLSDENATAVLQICQRLDGIPLALELAAAHTPLLTAQAIAERLIDRFKLLTRGSRTALPRHQTLRATLDWSYDLLSAEEQALFRRLAVFAGGWTLAAAQAVCASAGLEAEAVLDLLTALVQKSLVSHQAVAGETRYQMLETIGEYAREKLAAAQEIDRFCARQRDWCLQLVEEVSRSEEASRARLDQLAREHDNYRAALQWSLQQAQVAAALRLAHGLVVFWTIRGHWREGRAWIERALHSAGFEAQTGDPQVVDLEAQALCNLGQLAVGQRDFATAQAVLAQSIAFYRTLAAARALTTGEQVELGLGLNYLGFAAYYQGDYPQATALYTEALRLYQALPDAVGVGFTLTMLGRAANCQGHYRHAAQLGEASVAIGRKRQNVHLTAAALDVTGRAEYYQGNVQQARALLEESLLLSKELDFQQDVVDLLNLLGLLEFSVGDHQRTTALLAEGLALSQALTYSMGRAGSLSTLAEVALAEHDPARAKRLLAESLAAFRQLGMKWYLIRCLEIYAASEAADHQPARAACLLGAATAVRAALGAPLPPPDQPAFERAQALAQAELGQAAYAAARDAGGDMSLDQAIEYVLGEVNR